MTSFVRLTAFSPSTFGLLSALAFGAILYTLLSIVAAWRYLMIKASVQNAVEPVSILKPLVGLDVDLESNLRTFFEQDYSSFEILFAVREESDLAKEVVERLRREYPKISTKLLVTGEPPFSNAKVHSLDCMLAEAANDLVVMSDSDVRVTPAFLRTVAAELQDPRLGMATCPYRAVAGASLWSRLEAMGMNTDFWASALVARMMEGMRFAVGPTIVTRRRVLESIGGIAKLRDYLAEDFVLGKLAAAAGYQVILSSYVIEHHIGAATFRESVAHRLRWTRSTRRSRPVGYAGQLFTMPILLAGMVCAVHATWWPILLVSLFARIAAAYAVSRRVLRAKINWLLLPLEDLASVGFWIAGFFGDSISWRGRRYKLHSDGRFEPIAPRQ